MTSRCWAIVPAAGVGARMGSSTPKQYLALAGRLVIEWSLAPLVRSASVAAVVVATAPGDPFWEGIAAGSAKLRRVDGGLRRQDSVLRGLNVLEGLADPEDWALVHDAARPCLADEDLEELLARVEADGLGGLLACPLRDTLKHASSDGRVRRTVPRDDLWQALTPQVFRYGALRTALESAAEAGIEVTDEASAMELAGHSPLLVPGSPANIKITRPGDLALASAFLEGR